MFAEFQRRQFLGMGERKKDQSQFVLYLFFSFLITKKNNAFKYRGHKIQIFPVDPPLFLLSIFNPRIKLSNLIKIKTLLSNQSIHVPDRQLSLFNTKIYSAVIHMHVVCLENTPAKKEIA